MTTTRQGPRPRHIPQRTCVACRQATAKRQLIRIGRTPQGSVEPDPTGKKAGRGAYLCQQLSCWELALAKGRLDYALKAKLSAEEKAALLHYAQDLFATADTAS